MHFNYLACSLFTWASRDVNVTWLSRTWTDRKLSRPDLTVSWLWADRDLTVSRSWPNHDWIVSWPWPDRELTLSWPWPELTWPWRAFGCTNHVNQALKLISPRGILCCVPGRSVSYFNINSIHFVNWFPCSPQGILSDRAGMVGLQPPHTAKHSLDVCRSKSTTLNEMEHIFERVFATLRLGSLTFRHRASCILGQAFRYSPENAFYIFNQQIYFIIWYLLDRA